MQVRRLVIGLLEWAYRGSGEEEERRTQEVKRRIEVRRRAIDRAKRSRRSNERQS